MSDEPPRGLRATDVWLSRGGRDVLTGAALAVPPGAVTALIAPSGAGKSTLLRCLNRLLEPDRGTITLDGEDIHALPPRELRHRVGLVTQTPVMLEGSVRDNLAYGLASPLSDEDAAASLAAAGLDGSFAPRDAGALSGGERARVALARAIVRRPAALLLDEPTAALDADVARQVASTLRALAGEGLAICLAIHDVPFARAVADRVVGLDGLPVADDLPRDVSDGRADPPTGEARRDMVDEGPA